MTSTHRAWTAYAPPPPLPEISLDDAMRERVSNSGPGDTFMPPQCYGEPASVIESWVAEASLTGHRDPYPGKRMNPRFTWNVVVLLRIHTGQLAGKIIRARTRNVSLGGIGVQLRSVLPAGTFVEVMIEGRPFGVHGNVVHCTRLINGNLVGVRFDQPE